MYGSIFTGLVGPPYPYCLLVAFCVFFVFFYDLLHSQNTHKQKLHNKAKINIKEQMFCAYKLLRR